MEGFMMNINRVILIVMDSVGIGALPDADLYHDLGTNTIGNIYKAAGLTIPNLCKLGFSKIEGLEYLPDSSTVIGCYGKMMEASKGKDTTTGHWEMAGCILQEAFPVYPEGFPSEIIASFTAEIGTGVLGNRPASGTEIIELFGEEHFKTGYPIVYTSADSVFQIAAHEDIIPLEKLYAMCESARRLLTGKHAVGRVIARPFTGKPGSFTRTKNRKDFSLESFSPNLLDLLKSNSYDVMAVGKIEDIFASRGITYSVHSTSNIDGINQTIKLMKEDNRGLIFTNLVDFDMLYGHRNDINGYKAALEEFDDRVFDITSSMREDDLLIITADHGCDPTTPGTDHTREYVPLLVYGKNIQANRNLGIRTSFSDIAATILETFQIKHQLPGKSFLASL
jgi:phosphopentomutase